MPGASSGGYLPPIVATLVGDAADALAKIAEVQAALDALSKDATDIPITANASEALATIAAARATMNADALAPITFTIAINSAEALAELAVIRAIAGSAAGTITIPVDANVAPLIAKMAVAKAAASSAGGGLGILGTLLWGAGGVAGFAAFGSFMSLAGFGFERLITLAIGLAGSLAGALAGGALLAAGAFGVMAVGMGSDMLVMKTAITNTTSLAALQTAYNDAVAQYGPASAQAVAALSNYNFAISQLPVAMQASTVALATMLNNTKDQWQQATAAAQVAAQGIMAQVLQLADTYIPLVAAAALRNFNIISNAIKPLFAWLAGPQGMGVFKTLENYFAANLPNAIAAFTQGIEFLLKTFQYLASYTGGLTRAIKDFLTQMNTPAGFAKWEGIINTLIGMFKTWWALVKQVAITIYDLFSQSVGLGTTLVATITQMLVKLDAWLTSTSGKASVHNLFQVHLQELLAILAVLPSILGAFGQLYLAIAPPLVVIVTGLADMVGWMLKVPVAGTILAWGAAIALIASRMGILSTVMGIIGSAMIPLLLRGLATLAPGFAATAAAALGMDTALDANPISLIIMGIAALVIALALLVTHFKQVSDFLRGPWGTAVTIAIGVFMPFLLIPTLVIAHWQQLLDFFKMAWANLVAGAVATWSLIKAPFITTWNDIVSVVRVAVAVIIASINTLAPLVKAVLGVIWAVWSAMFTVLVNIVRAAVSVIGVTLYIVATVVKAVIAVVVAIWTAAFNLLVAIVRAAVAVIGGTISAIATFINTWIIQPIALVISWISGHLEPTFRVLQAVAGAVFGAIAGFINGVIGTIRTLITWIADAINWFKSLFNSATAAAAAQSKVAPGTTTTPSGGVTGVGHALGGIITAGTWGTVGEMGVESAYAMPGGGVQIYPNSGGGYGQGGMNMTVHNQITVQGGTTNAMTAAAVQQAVYNAMTQTIRQMKGGAKNYGFMPS